MGTLLWSSNRDILTEFRHGKAAGLCGSALMVKVAGVMVGLMKYVFMIKNSVTLSRAAFNPPWHLTRPSRRGWQSARPVRRVAILGR
jgi:hypothetical protein